VSVAKLTSIVAPGPADPIPIPTLMSTPKTGAAQCKDELQR